MPLPSPVECKRLYEINTAFELIAEHNGRKRLKIGGAAARVIALASAMDGKPVGFAQVLHKALRGCIGRADKDNVRAEVCAYRV